MIEKEVILIGDEDTVAGFNLTGLKRTYTLNNDNLNEIYGKVVGSNSLILLSLKASELLADRIDELRETSLVQIIPPKDEDYNTINEIIKDTIGFNLKDK